MQPVLGRLFARARVVFLLEFSHWTATPFHSFVTYFEVGLTVTQSCCACLPGGQSLTEWCSCQDFVKSPGFFWLMALDPGGEEEEVNGA